MPGFAKKGITTVALVHEFATYTKPDDVMSYIFKYADQMVFSAKVVRDDALRVCEELKTSEEIILPQGRCILPTENNSERRAIDSEKIREAFGDENHDDDVIRVVGMGTVDMRKGIDLFIECAHKVKQKAPELKIKFIWIGSGYSSINFYAQLLRHQIKCSHLEDAVQIMDAVTDLESAFKKTDLFLLSSRLDPLPNVGIDALIHGVPTICFDETTGLAGILKEYGQEKYCVVDYLAVEQAANNIIELALSSELRKKIGDDLAIKAKKTFDMEAYVSKLDSLAAGVRH